MAQVIGIGKQEINKITGAVKPAAPLPTISSVIENKNTINEKEIVEKEEVLSKEEKPKRGRKKKTEEV